MSNSVPIKQLDSGPFWEKKFLSIFRRLSLTGDGLIKKSDYAAWGDRYIEVGKIDGVKAKQIKRKLVKIWHDYLGLDAVNDEIGEKAFIQCLLKHKDRILETAMQLMSLMFDLADLNGNGVISKDEYELFLRVFNVNDPGAAETAFKIIDTNGNDELSYDEFVYAGCQYFLSNDESLPATHMFGPLI